MEEAETRDRGLLDVSGGGVGVGSLSPGERTMDGLCDCKTSGTSDQTAEPRELRDGKCQGRGRAMCQAGLSLSHPL